MSVFPATTDSAVNMCSTPPFSTPSTSAKPSKPAQCQPDSDPVEHPEEIYPSSSQPAQHQTDSDPVEHSGVVYPGLLEKTPSQVRVTRKSLLLMSGIVDEITPRKTKLLKTVQNYRQRSRRLAKRLEKVRNSTKSNKIQQVGKLVSICEELLVSPAAKNILKGELRISKGSPGEGSGLSMTIVLH
ncbi:uncharacterized protein LOC134531125 [Bacillus rossius redtenbacheri]|uniref:uncharacterized protein LOC134531125 n=1 Tax=Bacillus rossius redtenbacheri TaxID=93214 RepID=UPI002FDF007D